MGKNIIKSVRINIVIETLKIGIGFATLFFPPFLIASLGHYIQKSNHLSYLLVISTPFVTILMMNLIPQAWAVFPFYNILLIGLILIARKYGMSMKESLPMAIYFVFAISVLWEIPVQIGVSQNINALALSMFKMLGVPLLFFWMYQRGWRLNLRFNVLLSEAIMFGIILTGLITPDAISTNRTLFWLAHSYRLIWIVILGLEVLSVLEKNTIKYQPLTQGKLTKR